MVVILHRWRLPGRRAVLHVRRGRWSVCARRREPHPLGRDAEGKAYIGTTDPAAYVTDSIDALRALISAVKAGAADHLLA
ncbi:hypothetical protein ACGFYQ_09680 [Streptomyces sp. NPDC048258]|uniref:hypothetical protein n=1 Tax=Streptomyces sp. NPDC048258 TaxID=3365527 RepID=UPI00371C8814